jgi:hypothetical protein
MFLTKLEKTVWAVQGKEKAGQSRANATDCLYGERERERAEEEYTYISFNVVVI